ncbi:MAG: 50S ribosomal protein L11 methyltransferase [Deltaproteobacteria bacterium]|nr:50S ribosomal protein L11 methyltransferase [Deltaproteobacteria bacterium]
MNEQIWRLSVRTAGTSLDALSGAMYLAGYEGIEILPEAGDGDDHVTVRAYAVARHGLEELARVVAAVPGCLVGRIEEIEVEDWAEGWKKHFQPQEIGATLVVLPPWVSPKHHPDRMPVVINPGHAFGTGTHATTRLVLEALERARPHVPLRGPVVDLGTGSGILAIAAAKLGLAPVTAIDVDPEALYEAQENARANAVHLLVRTVEGDVQDVPDGARLVLANLSAPVHRSIAARLAPRLQPGGRALLSGLLADETDGIVAAWPAGWEHRVAVLEEWALVELVAPS